MNTKLSLLFVSPVVPKLTGTGIAMRAGLHIQQLASSFDVTLAILLDGQSEEDAAGEVPAAISTLCAEITVSSERSILAWLASEWTNPLARNIAGMVFRVPPRAQRHGAAKKLADRLSGRHFDVVHCFRLITGQAPQLLKSQGCRWKRAVLDMDDYESRTKRRYADTLLRARGMLQFLVGRFEARRWRAFESALVPMFDDVYVCSEMDRALLNKRFPGSRFIVIPNIVDEPAAEQVPHFEPFTFLFVGSLAYPPNRDAVLFFCTDIMPKLRQMAARPFRIQIVGPNADARLKTLDNGRDIEIVGKVPDVGPYYRRAGAAIVPLRAGGGTRIKILEAFSYSLPVISTAIGAEGLEVTGDENILIADTPESFAKACQKLLEDPISRSRMAKAGYTLFQERYTKGRLAQALEAAYEISTDR